MLAIKMNDSKLHLTTHLIAKEALCLPISKIFNFIQEAALPETFSLFGAIFFDQIQLKI
ncbi:MAG: hypothetical protein KAH20_02035 [Methylococcales bacterium]|nr:hypothetical protein [Methylococcales bacterium]